MMDWEVHEAMPKYDDIHQFLIWNGKDVRRVRRAGNHENFWPGQLLYTDCVHPLQNVICDERSVVGWKYA